MWQTFSIMWKLQIWRGYFKICRWKCDTVGWTMLKREKKWVISLSPCWLFPTCQFYMYCCGFIHCMKIPVIFFLMCSTHQPHWANKGKRMFQIYFCSSYLSEPNGWHVSQIGTHLIIIRFPLGLFPFSWLFCIHGCALAPGTSWVFPSLFRVWKAGVMISLMKVKRWKVTWGFIKWLHSMCACSPRTYIPLRVSNCLEGYQVDI